MTAHILIVEDDTELRKAIAHGLQAAGYHVHQAASGEAALELLTQAEPPYDVVLTDIVMGNIDGTDVLKATKAQPNPPDVLLLTGYGSLETALAALKAGAFDYLLKPCRMAHLLERIQAALEQRAERLRTKNDAEAWQTMSSMFAHLQGQTHTPPPAGPPQAAPPAPQSPPPQTPPPEPAAAPPEHHLEIGALRIDTHRHEVWFAAQPVHVTLTEYTILTCLAATPERVVAFDDIAAQIHDENFDQSRARPLLAWHIGNLRKKIDRRYLVSVRGVGYMLTVPPDSDKPAAP
jgi:DNA-binding response OmpR family regulator